MKQYFRNIDERTGEGMVKLEAKDSEDMWHLYNLLAPGDYLRAKTFRKVNMESATGSNTSERIVMNLTIRVTSVSYDAAGSAIRAKGKAEVGEDDKYVKKGQFHTIELEPNRAFQLGKSNWDSVYLERLNLAINPSTDADLAAIVMQEGLAHVLLVNRSLTLTRARIEVAIPRKGKNALYNRDSALLKFFDAVSAALVQRIELDTIKVLLIASPGYVKDQFFKRMTLEAQRSDTRAILNNRHKFVLTHASSGHRHTLQEVLSKPELQQRLAQTKAVSEVRVLQTFYTMLADDPNRAVYGPAHVHYAMEMGAVGTLLVSDSLFRSVDIPTRKKYVELVETVKASGADVVVFSAQHVTGQRLAQMSGIAAILRYPLPDIDDLVQPEDASSADDDAEGEQ